MSLKSIPKFVWIILIIALIIIPYNIYISKYSAKNYFTDKKVVALCNAAKKGDTKKIDKLLAEGVDINTVGKTGLNPLYWLLVMNKEFKKKRIGFKYLLEKGADPMQVHEKSGLNVIHTTARYKNPDYLKMILKYGHIKRKDLDAEIPNEQFSVALMQAMATNRFENFKLLLDAGADMNWRKTDEVGMVKSVLRSCSLGGNWKFVYELLKRGVDYSEDLEFVKSMVGLDVYSAATSIDFRGVDYRQKVVQFFREKGIEMKPGMSKNEKYVNENGKDVLYVNDGLMSDGKRIKGKPDKWVKFSESTFYKKATKDPNQQKYLDKELEKMKIERLGD